MPLPDHFKKFESRLTCADCTLRTYNQETQQIWCGKHEFPIPREFKSKLKSLYQYTCRDVVTAVNFIEEQQEKNSKGHGFDEWWADVVQVFKDKDQLPLLNTEEPESYKEYFLDGDSPQDVFDTEISYVDD